MFSSAHALAADYGFTKKNQNLTADNTDSADLHGSKKFKAGSPPTQENAQACYRL
jgi:hypothetical protein